jgi:hypothetical protein
MCIMSVSVVLVIRPEKCMNHIILSYMSCLAEPYFYIISWKEQFKKIIEHKMHVLSFSANFIWNIFCSKKKNNKDITINVHRSSDKEPIILVRL